MATSRTWLWTIGALVAVTGVIVLIINSREEPKPEPRNYAPSNRPTPSPTFYPDLDGKG